MWLEQCLQLPYRKTFFDARIDGQRLIELTEEQLGELGVTESSHLLRLLSHIAVFRSQLGRSLLVSEDVVRQSPSGIDNASLRFQRAQGQADRSGPSGQKQRSASVDRLKASPQKSPGSAGAITPRQRISRQIQSARAKSTPGLNPVLQMSSGSPAGGQRVEKASRTPQQTPQKAGRSAGQGAPQAQPRTRSTERRSADGAGRPLVQPSSVTTPRSYADAQPAMGTPPATSSTWSPDPSSLAVPAFASEADATGNIPNSALEDRSKDLGGTSELIRETGEWMETPAKRSGSAPSLLSARSPRSPPESIVALKQELSTTSKGGLVNSEFGKDRNRGAHFFSQKRQLLEPALKSKQGPEYYEKSGRFYRGAMANNRSPQFGRDTRKTLECMFTRGQDGPGVGRYEPPPARTVRGGSIGTSSRFRRPTDPAKQEKSPGPVSYSPQHHFVSNFK